MVKILYLIRHGETIDASDRRYKGHLDVPLSRKGIEQMEQLSALINSGTPKLRASTLSAIYSSDLTRAVKSAEIIARPHGLKPIIVPGLRERNFGEWEGMTFDEIEKRWPHAFNAWRNDPLRHTPPGGESTIEAKERVIEALNRILNSLNGRDNISIAIVAHGGVNRIILCHVLGIPLENIFRIEQDYGCLNLIEFHDGYPVVKLVNYQA